MPQAIVILLVVIAVFVGILFFLHGLSKRSPRVEDAIGFKDKKLWDYLHLVFIPLVLATVALVFNAQQTATSLAFNAQQNQTTLAASAAQRREVVLEGYLDRMTDLMLNHDLKRSKHGDPVRGIAQESTKIALAQLDPAKMAFIVQYLYNQGLISGSDPIVNLSGAYLVGAQLGWAQLQGANLRFTFLTDADLHNADLSLADLTGACLNGANFHGATFDATQITQADMDEATLTGTRTDQLIGSPSHQVPYCQAQLPT